jgi:hypothetical protein
MPYELFFLHYFILTAYRRSACGLLSPRSTTPLAKATAYIGKQKIIQIISNRQQIKIKGGNRITP